MEPAQTLIRLQDTLPASNLNELRAQHYEALATEARLLAEQSRSDEITFPDELSSRFGDAAAQRAMAGQKDIFLSRLKVMEGRPTIFERTISGLETEIEGPEGQMASSQSRKVLIDDQLADVQSVYDHSLADKPRMLALQGTKAEFEGAVTGYKSSIGVARQRIGETELRRSELKSPRDAEIDEQLRDTRARAYELGQRLAAAQAAMGRTVIRSPVAGIVTGLQVHTVGGVIAARQPTMNVVPVSDKLVVQATIDPLDIDQVVRGQDAQVWLLALNRRSQRPIEIVAPLAQRYMSWPVRFASWREAA